jgi:hypothetical protein
MGVLAPGSAYTWPYAQPPIKTSGHLFGTHIWGGVVFWSTFSQNQRILSHLFSSKKNHLQFKKMREGKILKKCSDQFSCQIMQLFDDLFSIFSFFQKNEKFWSLFLPGIYKCVSVLLPQCFITGVTGCQGCQWWSRTFIGSHGWSRMNILNKHMVNGGQGRSRVVKVGKVGQERSRVVKVVNGCQGWPRVVQGDQVWSRVIKSAQWKSRVVKGGQG